MYPFWLDVVSGGFQPANAYAVPVDREWIEAFEVMNGAYHSRSPKRTSSFDYDAIRTDIHPQVRSQFLMRFLSEMDSMKPERLKGAMRSVHKDAGFALVSVAQLDDATVLAEAISQGQAAAIGKVEGTDIVLWWANILGAARGLSNERKRMLIEHLWAGLQDTNPLIQLSSVFALARLGTPNISSLVDDALQANSQWAGNEALKKWLADLRRGSRAYPGGLSIG